jgi:hypothetical protein
MNKKILWPQLEMEVSLSLTWRSHEERESEWKKIKDKNHLFGGERREEEKRERRNVSLSLGSGGV